ncbi:MAG: DNA-binding protein [Crocinitomicaceae bacterium]|nr:DNA-binding protein [Crocinitomicaceae bacterium]|tara:strand:- start:566 stop:907 length:342 start_codon:yes stop_codon:yes gene_type:complete
MENNEDYREQEEIYANAVRAGKRTYFFDVRATRNNDYYLTITESKRKYDDGGNYHYQKHKIFLYKEDFEKFGKALSDSFQKIIELKTQKDQEVTNGISEEFTNINFDDLDDNP